MSSTYIPSFHFEPQSKKLTAEWGMQVVNHCVFNANNVSLLDGKDINEIETYSVGKFDMNPFKRMFKSMRKAQQEQRAGMNPNNPDSLVGGVDTSGLDFTPLPLIPTKLNAAVSVVHKIPVEVECVAMDSLAIKRKEEDLKFLKNKPVLEEELQDFADQLQIRKVDLGEAKYGGARYSTDPMGFDLNEPDEADIFARLIYALNVETAFEKVLQQVYHLKKAANVKLLEITDHYKYGVGVNRCFRSSMTSLPDIKYVYPNDVSTPKSYLPDYSDNTHRIIDDPMTVMELFNNFSEEIRGEEHLEEIINGKGTGYCACNKKSSKIDRHQWGEAKVQMKFIEVKSIDWIGIAEKKGKTGTRYFTNDESSATRKIWGQNTYGFWWLVNTEYIFGMHILDYSYRTEGIEAYQNFSTNIYRSQKKSAVELSIGENKKAQIADIKLQHALIMSLPAGKYIDIRFIRNAIKGLVTDGNNKYTAMDLLTLAFERNIIIGDTEGFDGKNDGQIKPFMDIPGGLKSEIQGYITTILSCNQNIGNYTGINEQLTGQSANPEGLVGMQKLLINSSLNALYYCNEAIRNQYQDIFHIWANHIQDAIKRGGKSKEMIISMIGSEDTKVLEGLSDSPLHKLTIRVEIGQREEERQRYNDQLNFLKQQKIITSTHEYLLSAIENPKERFALLAVIEKKHQKREEEKLQRNYENQQQIVAQQGENMVQAEGAKAEGELKLQYAKGDVQSKLIQLGESLKLNKTQMDAIVKRMLQQDRGRLQTEKAIKTVEAKSNAKQQEAENG